ncbi:MAG: Ku protein, partial [Paeniglutamicibacter sp.]
PGQFRDDYQVQLRTLIREKLEKGDSLDTEATFGAAGTAAEAESGEVIDLMEALKRSIARKSGSAAKDSGTGSSTEAKKPAPKKAAPRKKAAAKKKQAASTPDIKSKGGKKATGSSRKGA